MRLPHHLRTRLLIGLILALVIWLVTLAHAATLTLAWDTPVWPVGQAPVPLVGYVLERNALEIARPAASPYTDTVAPGAYIYTVRALYAENQLSPQSIPLVVTVNPTQPAVSVNFTCVFTPSPDPLFVCKATNAAPDGPYPRLPVGTVTLENVDSQAVGYEATRALDGVLTTFWHSEYRVTPRPQLPHTLTLDLGKLLWCDGLAYLPRQDGQVTGILTSYRLEASTDLATWTVLASGTWVLDATEKVMRFAPTRARYVRLVGLTSDGTVYASAAEVGIFARE